jgi:hypothetical protein
LIHAILRKESKKNGCYSCVIQGRTYTLSSPEFARQDTLRRSAPPKRITRGDTISRLMMESLRPDWPGKEPSSGIYTVGARGKAKKIPALRPTDVYWPWPLNRADLALPVWKQQLLFRIRREAWTDWTGRVISLSLRHFK